MFVSELFAHHMKTINRSMNINVPAGDLFQPFSNASAILTQIPTT